MMPSTRLHSPILAILAIALSASLPSLAQQTDPPKCRYSKLATLPVRYIGFGLGPAVTGSINGKPADMLINTGSYDVLLTRTAAARHGLNLWPTKNFSQHLSGYQRIYTARVRQFAGALANVKGLDVRVLGDSGSPPPYEAMLGASLLMQTDFEISLATKELRFFKPVNCENRSLAYWDKNAIELPFIAGSREGDNPAFTLFVNGKKVKAVISSASSFTTITRPAAQRLGLKIDVPSVGSQADVARTSGGEVAFWSTKVDTLQLGDEIIQNADVGVVDGDLADIDMFLGADFLRTHRVLFAMSQQKLYFSYLGGEPLGQMRSIQPWLQQEADDGNADAQLLVAQMHQTGTGVPRDQAKADAWVDRAAAAGHSGALLVTGTRLLKQGRHLDAVAPLRQGLDGLPGERNAALWLYVARMRAGQGKIAKQELEAAFARQSDDWPGPIAAFYLGKLDAQQLLQLASGTDALAPHRTCLARIHIAEWHAIAGEKERAAALRAEVGDCDAPRLRSS